MLYLIMISVSFILFPIYRGYILSFFPERYRHTINDAVKEWQKYTCLKFKPANEYTFREVGHRNYVDFVGVPRG